TGDAIEPGLVRKTAIAAEIFLAHAGDGAKDAGPGVDLADAIVVAIGDVDIAILGDEEIVHEVELAFESRSAVAAIAFLAAACERGQAPLGVQLEHPMAECFGDIQIARGIAGDAERGKDLARVRFTGGE